MKLAKRTQPTKIEPSKVKTKRAIKTRKKKYLAREMNCRISRERSLRMREILKTDD